MKKFFGWFLIPALLCSSQNILAQDSLKVVDSTAVLQTSPADTIPDTEKFYMFENLVRKVFGGYGQAGKFNPRQQMFDFMEMGRPQFVAPLNMYPHQMTYVYNSFSLNEHSNGMLNTRFLSADHTDNIDNSINPFAVNSVNVNTLTISEKQAYTRMKYSEGDQNYSDLDIFFVRDLAKDVKLQLAGFNKGFNGFGYNSRHTGVAYNTKLSYTLNESFSGDFSWMRNHEISGMGSFEDPENFTYRSDAERFATRLFYKYDSTSNDHLSLGVLYGYNFHRNFSKAKDFYSMQKSDNYRAYLSADISDSVYEVITTLRLDNYNNLGTVFSKDFTDIILSAYVFGQYKMSRNINLNGSAEINYLDSYNPALGLSAGVQLWHSPLLTNLKASIHQRLPNPVERSIVYQDYKGNPNLDVETLLSAALAEKWVVNDQLFLQAGLGLNQLQNEIIFADNTFNNGADRSWFFINGMGSYKLWLFSLYAGGQIISAEEYISPRHSLWSELSFHGNLFDGTIILDLTGFTHWNDQHDLIEYDPIVNRFYRGIGENLSYLNVGFKAVATVSDAELFMEMDNLLQQEISYIYGYSRYTTRVRFGVNWIFWD